MSRSFCGSGIGIGTIIAVILSWILNESIGYMILHGICGWFYVVYVLIHRWSEIS